MSEQNKKHTHKLHYIGNAHLDPIWLWRWQEGFAEVKATFQSAVDRMKEYPEFIFTCSSAQYYKWVEENCPELFEEVKKFVKNGQWHITGGWWVQADCNMPSGEALARHALYSQRYFLEKFGVTAKVGYNVDSFGHCLSLPQILKKSGMDYYVFKNPPKQEFPYVFKWQGHDGSSVIAHRVYESYMSWDGYQYWSPGRARGYELRKKTGNLFELCDKINLDMTCFFGVGNHGGGPTVAHIETIKDLQKEYGKENIIFSTPEKYFESIDKTNLPVYTQELNHSARGGYTSNASVKMHNRKAEHRLLEAEKFNLLSNKLTGCELKTKQIAYAWENVMLIHFHDALCGVSIKPAYPDIYEFYGESLATAGKIANHSLQKISWNIDTQKSPEVRKDKEDDLRVWEKDNLGTPLVVFNSLSWDVEIPVEVNKTVRKIEDSNGSQLEIQNVKGWHCQEDFDKWHTLFYGKIPAMGYAVYWIYRAYDLPDHKPNPLKLLEKSPYILENDRVIIEFEKHSGYIKRYFDKESETELLTAKSAVPLVGDDYYGNPWATAETDIMARFSDADFELLEDGPLRQRVRVTSYYNKSEVRQDFILYKDSKDIEVRGRVIWQEKCKILKISYCLNAENTEAVYDIPYGCITRNTTDSGEVCGGQWLDVSGTYPDSDKKISLAIINDGKYGHEVIANDIRMSIVRSPLYSDGGPRIREEMAEYTDIGLHEFSYKIIPGVNKSDRANIIKKAYELNVPANQIIETYHSGKLPQKYKGLSVSAENVVVTAIKESEDGSAYVLRCYETIGKDTDIIIDIPMLKRKIECKINKYEVKTFWLPKDESVGIDERNFLEM